MAEALRSLDVSVNRYVPLGRKQSEFPTKMAEANQAFLVGDRIRAIQLLADARQIAEDAWLRSLLAGGELPNVSAVTAEAEAMLRQAWVASSTIDLRDATLTLRRARATLSEIPSDVAVAQIHRLDELLRQAMAMHGEAAEKDPPRNPVEECLMRVRGLLHNLDETLEFNPEFAGLWASLAVEDAMTAVAFSGRELARTVPSDLAAEMKAQGVVDETEQLSFVNGRFMVEGLDHLVAAAALRHAARVQADLWIEREPNENWLLAARRLVELSSTDDRARGLVLALSGVADACVSLGDAPSLDEAASLLDEAHGVLDSLGDEGELRAQICLSQGWLRHNRRQLDGTLPIVDRAIAAAGRSGAARLERAAQSLRSQFLSIAGRHEEAVAEARRAVEATHDDAAGTHHLNLAVVLLNAGDRPGAADEVRAGLASAIAEDPLGAEVMRLLFVGAAILDRQNAHDSLAATEAAEAVLDVTRLRIGDAADRIGFDDAVHHRELAAKLVQRRLDAEDFLGALSTADRHRARSLAQALGSCAKQSGLVTESSLKPPENDSTMGELVAFISRTAALELSRQGVPPPLDGRALADIVANAGRTVVLFHPVGDQLLVFVVRPGSQVVIGTATAVPSLTRILALTDALRSLLGVVVSARAARGEAPKQSFEDLASAFADEVPEQADAALDRLRHELHEALFSEVVPLLKECEPLLIVPYRELAVIPLSVLTAADGRSLAQRHPISVLPSLASLGVLAQSRSSVATAVVVGDPAVDPSIGLGPLPGAATEARQISAILQDAGLATTLLLHEEATESAFRSKALGARVVHLACHAAVRQVAASSPLFLTPDPPEDGLLLPGEIAHLNLDGALVVLSACQSGLGRTTADGVLGLGRAFVQAGARAVVLSLWRVSDSATKHLMRSFYGALRGKGRGIDKSLDVSAAMRHAQLATSADIGSHPGVWGAWLVVGDGGWRLT